LQNGEATGHAHGQPGKVKQGITRAFLKIAKSEFEIAACHDMVGYCI
jgi:hypothetical protein